MYIQKRTIWNISCRIKQPDSRTTFVLPFTTDDFQKFVPPNVDIAEINICAEIGFNHSNLKTGIYETPLAYCLVGLSESGVFIHGISHQWEELKSLIAKIVSSAGRRPKISHAKKFIRQEVLDEWVTVVHKLQKW